MNYELFVDADDYLSFRFYDGGWKTLRSDLAFTPEDIGVWHHVALTYGRSSGLAKLFLNTNCVGISTITGKLPMNDEDLYIGARKSESGAANHFPGAIDEVCVECVEKVSASYERYWDVDGDTDSDGLGDLWEWTHFGGLTLDGDDDPDNDEMTNAEEFSCGTDPNDGDSYFAVASICSHSEGIEIQIKTVKGWRYTVLCTDIPDSVDWHSCGTMIGDGSMMTVIDAVPIGVRERWYRVLVE
jgi:hypothetical protein